MIPELQPDESPPGPIDAPGALVRFFEGIRRLVAASLAGRTPGAVMLDDLHWCDAASLEVLAHIARRLAETPVLFVAAWRSEEVDQDHPLHRVVAEASEHGDVRSFQLERLGFDDVRSLVTDATEMPDPDTDQLARRLMSETEGIPFFVVEYLNAMADAGMRFNYGLRAAPVEMDQLISLIADRLGIVDVRTEESEPGELAQRTSATDVAGEYNQRLYLQKLWSEIGALPVRQRRALLLNLKDEQGLGCITLFQLTGVATLRQMADAMEMRVVRDPEPGVVRAVPHGGRGQHDSGNDEEDDPADRRCTDNHGHHDRRGAAS